MKEKLRRFLVAIIWPQSLIILGYGVGRLSLAITGAQTTVPQHLSEAGLCFVFSAILYLQYLALIRARP